MTQESLKQFFLYCFVFNYCVMIIWFVMWRLFKQPYQKLLATLTGFKAENFDNFNFQFLAIYKILVFIFNVAPWLALQVMTS